MSAVARSRLCWCGSGRHENACHELPARERRRRKLELYVLAEANDLAALFPAVRPRDDIFAVYADHAASLLEGSSAQVPAQIVEDGLALLGAAERERIVRSWRDEYPDRWAGLIADGGDETLVMRAVAAGAVRVAILERRPLPRAAVAGYEGGLFADLPANALTLLVAPPSVWSIDEAVIASRICPGGRRFEPARFDALERYARRCVASAQLTRLRAAAGRIALQLPFSGLPTASATIGAGCALIDADEDWCAAIAARQLALYASDPQVVRSSRPSFRPRL